MYARRFKSFEKRVGKGEIRKMNNKLGILGVIIAIIALILAGVAVDLNRIPGPEGKQGIQGNVGSQGIKGENGIDALINELPTINLLDTSGTYVGIIPLYINYCKYTYGIHVFVNDPENETMKVTFYYGDYSGGPWNEVAVFYGGDGIYSASKVFIYSSYQGKKTIYWLVEAWDGSDISIEKFPYTIIP